MTHSGRKKTTRKLTNPAADTRPVRCAGVPCCADSRSDALLMRRLVRIHAKSVSRAEMRLQQNRILNVKSHLSIRIRSKVPTLVAALSQQAAVVPIEFGRSKPNAGTVVREG